MAVLERVLVALYAPPFVAAEALSGTAIADLVLAARSALPEIDHIKLLELPT